MHIRKNCCVDHGTARNRKAHGHVGNLVKQGHRSRSGRLYSTKIWISGTQNTPRRRVLTPKEGLCGWVETNDQLPGVRRARFKAQLPPIPETTSTAVIKYPVSTRPLVLRPVSEATRARGPAHLVSSPPMRSSPPAHRFMITFGNGARTYVSTTSSGSQLLRGAGVGHRVPARTRCHGPVQRARQDHEQDADGQEERKADNGPHARHLGVLVIRTDWSIAETDTLESTAILPADCSTSCN